MITYKRKIIAALTVCHGIYKKAVFVMDGQPVQIHFLTLDEYRQMVDTLSPAKTYEWTGMLKKVDERKSIYYCVWTVKMTEYHLITNKIQELIDIFIKEDIATFEMDMSSIEMRGQKEVN